MKNLLIILAAIAFFFIIKFVSRAFRKKASLPEEPEWITLPATPNNDKIVLITGEPYENIRKAAQQFCLLYRQQEASMLHLTRLSATSVAITFPNNCSFTHYCFLVNYLSYPEGFIDTPQVRAWATMPEKNNSDIGESTEKKAMLFMPEKPQEYDCIYLTTIEDQGYVISFSTNKPQMLALPLADYIKPPIAYSALQYLATELIQ